MRSTSNVQITRREILSVDPETNKGDMRIYFDAEIEVFFGDGRPVLETLQALQGEVKATVALFKTGIKTS